MKVLRKDRAKGVLRLRIDSLDDLWTLRNLIQSGDLVTADTVRTAEVQDDKIRSDKGEKKRMRLGVRVEQVEWHDFDDHLRVLGTIETGPQDHGRHHTHVIRDQGDRLEITKRGPLQRWHFRLLDDAEAATQRPQVILLAIDDAEAQFGILKSYGLQVIGTLSATGQGKRFGDPEEAKRRFYEEVLRSLSTIRRDPETPFIVVGPGWWREEFLQFASEKNPALVAGAATDGTSQGGRAGLQEALRRGMIEQVARDHRVAQDTAKVEEVLRRIAQDEGLVAYGPEEVRRAVEMGAAEELLVTDEVVRTGGHPEIMDAAEKTRCHVHVMATSHEAGAQLDRLSGVAALLRFQV